MHRNSRDSDCEKRTPDDSNWQWGTAIDFQSINADYVITGILTDKNGKFYLNLDTGELRMKDGNVCWNNQWSNDQRWNY